MSIIRMFLTSFFSIYSIVCAAAVLDASPNFYITKDDPLTDKLLTLSLSKPEAAENIRIDPRVIGYYMPAAADGQPYTSNPGAYHVLLLSDGLAPNDGRSLRLRDWYMPILPKGSVLWTEKTISLDPKRFNYVDEFQSIDYAVITSWNTLRPHPLVENIFDLIVMRNGACYCYYANVDYYGVPTGCGGLNPSNAPHVFNEIARVLNKRNKNAFAYLHGHEQNSSGSSPSGELLKEATRAVQTQIRDVVARVVFFCPAGTPVEFCKQNPLIQNFGGVIIMPINNPDYLRSKSKI